MHQFYVQVLTPGAVETLAEFAVEEQLILGEKAQFVPHSDEQIATAIMQSVKNKWLNPDDDSLFEELPDYLIPVTRTVLITTEYLAFSITDRVTAIPIFEQDGEWKAATDFINILSFEPVEGELLEDLPFDELLIEDEPEEWEEPADELPEEE